MRFHSTMFLARICMITIIFLLVKVESQKSRKHRKQDQQSPINLSKTESNEFESSTTETAPIQIDDTATSNDNVKFDQLPIVSSRASRQLSELLSSDIFLETNPIHYLIRESSKSLVSFDFYELITVLTSRLKTNQFSERYTPYARVLLSIVRAQMALYNLRLNIEEIQQRYEIFDVPAEISTTPELSASGLFSPDVFSDPDPPTKLLENLMQIPKNDIPELKIALKKFTKIPKNWKTTPFDWQRCVWYTRALLLFFKKKSSVIDDLIRDKAEIQGIPIDSYQSSDDISPNNES